MWQGTITQGDDEDGPRRRSNIPARRLTAKGPGGEALEVIHAPHEGSSDHEFLPVRDIQQHFFDVCPICLSPAPDTLEHLPPAGLGGTPMTRTCARCNNGFGRIESQLIDWRDDAYRLTSVTAEGIVGARRLPRILHRQTPTGEFVLLVDGPLHPEAEPMLQGNGFSLTITPPAPHLYKLAALKQAYLAACLDMKAVPYSPTAEAVRRELLAARDAPARRQISSSEFVLSMPIMRTHEHPRGSAALLGVINQDDGRGAWWIALASTIAVPWPFPDLPPVP